MQTEYPRHESTSGQAQSAPVCAPATFDPSELSEDDLELIDLRYHQFVAQAELDHLMDEL